MGNPLFQNQQQSNQGNPVLNLLGQLKSMGPSGTVFNQMYNNNPQFKQFADSLRGKTPEQAFREHGLDFNQFRSFHW